MAVNDSTQDWAAGYNREEREQAERGGGDSGVAMMAAAVDNNGNGR